MALSSQERNDNVRHGDVLTDEMGLPPKVV